MLHPLFPRLRSLLSLFGRGVFHHVGHPGRIGHVQSEKFLHGVSPSLKPRPIRCIGRLFDRSVTAGKCNLRGIAADATLRIKTPALRRAALPLYHESRLQPATPWTGARNTVGEFWQ
jgi:hypothetical protein